MKTVINLRFDKGTKLGKFISENEIDQLDDYDEMFNIGETKFLPRIGETFHVEFDNYGYQKSFIHEVKKIIKGTNFDIHDLFEGYYKVKDVRYFMGSNDFGDIYFIEILLGV